MNINKKKVNMEEWKDIKGFEGYYKVSSYGNVYSLHYNKVLKPGTNRGGYFMVILQVNKLKKAREIHTLVWEHFGDGERNGRILEVDHKDENKINNNISNLQLLTHRCNISKSRIGTSKYTGVYWNKAREKWMSRIQIDGKNIFLGRYKNEYDAHLAYQQKLSEIECQ